MWLDFYLEICQQPPFFSNYELFKSQLFYKIKIWFSNNKYNIFLSFINLLDTFTFSTFIFRQTRPNLCRWLKILSNTMFLHIVLTNVRSLLLRCFCLQNSISYNFLFLLGKCWMLLCWITSPLTANSSFTIILLKSVIEVFFLDIWQYTLWAFAIAAPKRSSILFYSTT